MGQRLLIGLISILLASCGSSDATSTATLVQADPVATLQPRSREPVRPTNTPVPSLNDPQEPEIPEQLASGGSLLLYTALHHAPDKMPQAYGALRTWPMIPPFGHSRLETFYDNPDEIECFECYFLNYRPHPSPDGRFLLIPNALGRDLGLWLADLQAGSLRQLSTQPQIAAWSPTGDQIAYVEEKTLYTLAINEGAVPVPLFSHPELRGIYVRWAPDGRWISITTHPPSTACGALDHVVTVWLISPGERKARDIATVGGGPCQPSADSLQWSPDSQYLIIHGVVLGLDGARFNLGTITQGIGISWAHQKPELLVSSFERGLQIISLQSEVLVHITDRPVRAWALSHSGRSLAYTPDTESPRFDIFVFNLVEHVDQYIGAVPKQMQHSVAELHWDAQDEVLIVDERTHRSPIWALRAQPGSLAEIVVDDGYLIDVLPNYSAAEDYFTTGSSQLPYLTPTPSTVAIVNTALLNVRSGPDLSHPIVGRASLGERYLVSGKNHDGTWWQIDFNGRKGWVLGELVKFQDAMTTPAALITPFAFTPVPTSTPLPALRGCWSQSSSHHLEGRLYVNGKPTNGYTIVLSEAPDGPILETIRTGPHGGNTNWDNGYFSYVLEPSDVLSGSGARYVWVVDEQELRLSEIVHWRNDCNRVWVVFEILDAVGPAITVD